MSEKQAPILVVDDEPEMCWILENIIRKTGFTCRTALNAREAMALTKSNKFVMAFLDAKLPDIDGLEFARKLRKTNARLQIAIVSGYFYQDDPTIKGALQAGLIAAFVGKPFDHDEIVRIITHYARWQGKPSRHRRN
jgi:DNA-binding NtrC family response regulator